MLPDDVGPVYAGVSIAAFLAGTVAFLWAYGIAVNRSRHDLIGIGGLGALFTRGFQLFYTPPIVTGVVLSVLLAAIADVLIVLFQRSVTPWTRAVAGRG